MKLIFLQNKKMNALIYGQRYNLFDLRQRFFDSNKYLFAAKIFCRNQTNIVSLNQKIPLHKKKRFKQIIFLIQSNIFSEYTWSALSTSASKFQPVKYSRRFFLFSPSSSEIVLNFIV